ncbi:MAG: hypothetical protein ISN28_09425, partial [Ectothiorhodospiraceae bacterium AqS1]|nr:hypothetical protein [Ectothiorhodospiraceae bacterium AqS1]
PSNSDVTVDDASLIFTTGNWNSTQTVTVNGADDADGIDDRATLRVSATGGGYNDVDDVDVSVTVDDNDTLGMTVSKTTLTVTEQSSDTFTVKLDTQPSGDVRVSIAQTGTNNADVTTNPTSLTFTTGNWDTAQTVTVNGADDADGFNDSATLQVKATGGGYDSVTAEEVVVTVRDNDPLGKTVSVSTLTVEEGSSSTFTVELDTQPSANVTVNITQTGTTNADVTVSPTSLIFTTGNWDTAQTVTVNGADDTDGFNDSATLQVKATGGGYDSVTAEEIVVTVRDNDPLGLTVSATTLAVTEQSSATFTVKLDTQPSDDVTVTIAQTGTSNSDITVNNASLTFTTSNWNSTQTVTVNGADDADGFNDRATLRVSATDGGYNNVDHVDVAVTVNDNDPLGMTVSASTLTVNENSNNTFTVNLDTQPSGNVTVDITQSGTANTDVRVSPASLTFTTDNWGTTQTVTVSAAEDNNGFDETVTLEIDPSSGGYDNVADEEVVVTVDDNDPLGITVSKTTLTVNENSSGTFTVNLDTQP